MPNLNRCNFYKNFKNLEILNYIIRKVNIDDQKLFVDAMKITKEEAFIKVSNIIRKYKKNIEAPFIIESQGNLIGEIFIFIISTNDNAIGLNIDLYNNYTDIFMLINLFKKVITFARYIFKVNKIFLFCDKSNNNLNEVYRKLNVEYLLDVKIEKFKNEKSLYQFNIISNE